MSNWIIVEGLPIRVYVRMPKRRKGTSGYFGTIKTLSGKYQAQIYINGKYKFLGSSYDTAKQAAQAHDKEAINY